MEYIISQIAVVLCYVFLGISYVVKNRNVVLVYSLLSIVLNGVSYLCLSAWSGVAMIVVALLRNVIFMIQNRKEKSEKLDMIDYIILAVLYVISIIFAVLTYDGIFSLFSVFATMIYTFAIWQKQVNVYRIAGLVAEICTLVYFIFIGSHFGIALEAIVIIVQIISIINYYREKLKTQKTEG